MTIYELRPTSDDTRPQIDYQDPRTTLDPASTSNLEVYSHPQASKSTATFYSAHPATSRYDFYAAPGTLGLLSKRAKEVLRPFAAPCFGFVAATLNGLPYSFIVRTATIDALDPERSEVECFRSNPKKAKRIVKYAFINETIYGVQLFCIPESLVAMFATDVAVEAIHSAGLVGFDAIALVE